MDILNSRSTNSSFTAKMKGPFDRSVEIDKTLSSGGKAADAAATGAKIAQLASQVYSEIALERARINNLAKLNEGSTTGDAELQDIRVDNGGRAFSSAGVAVRTQVGELRDMMARPAEFVPVDKDSNLLTREDNKYISGDGKFVEQSGYTTLYFKAVEPFSCYITGRYVYLSLSVFNGSIGENFVKRFVGESLPTEVSPIQINAGQTIAISYTVADFLLYHNSVYLGYKTSDAFHLSDEVLRSIPIPPGLTNTSAYIAVTEASEVFTVVDGYIGPLGSLLTDSSSAFKTYYIVVDKDCSLYFAQYSGVYLSLARFYDSLGKGFITRYRNLDGNLPNADNPIEVKAGETIAVSVRDVYTNFTLYGNNNVFGLQLGEDVGLGESHKRQIREVALGAVSAKKPLAKYVTGAVTSYLRERIDIYIPTAVGYVKYRFGHVVDSSINADNWRIVGAFACDEDLNDRFQITSTGEWEMAMKIEGRPDFIGGNLHGDEVVNAVHFFVDDVKKTLDDLSQITEFKTLRIVEDTQMYDPNDNTTKVATHGKEYTFTADGLTLKQSVNWETRQNIATSYMAMLPIFRGNDNYSALQITDRYYCDADFVEYDVSVPGDNAGFGWKKDVRSATIYSDKSGVCASMEIVKTPNTVGGGWFMVANVEQYNKLYFTCAGLNGTHVTEVGERWNTETRYNIQVNSQRTV